MSDPEDTKDPWVITGDHEVLCTLDYRGVAVTLTSTVLLSGITSLGYRYTANGEHFDDGLDLDGELLDIERDAAFGMLREIYEEEINELFKLAYPWQAGDKGVWNGKMVTVTEPLNEPYLYVTLDGERITAIRSSIDPVPPARTVDL